MRSEHVTKGPERAPNRSLFYALDYTPEDLDPPLIAMVSAHGGGADERAHRGVRRRAHADRLLRRPGGQRLHRSRQPRGGLRRLGRYARMVTSADEGAVLR